MIYVKLLLMAAAWGGTFIAGKNLALSVGPYTGALLRYLAASLFLSALMLKSAGPLPRASARLVLTLVAMGLTGIFAYNVFFLKGLRLIEAGRASVIVATNPIVIAAAAAVFLGERLNLLKSAGILLSVGGAVLAIARGDFGALLRGGLGEGELAVFGCVASWVAFTLLARTISAALSPLAVVGLSSFAGTLLLVPPALAEGFLAGFPFRLADWANAFFLGFFGTVLAFIWYTEGLRTIGAVRAGLFINFVPIFAILLAFFMLGEPLRLSLLAGALLVSAGVFLTTIGSRRG
jgi:drug/metabolite transporter (DMT)-like permease